MLPLVNSLECVIWKCNKVHSKSYKTVIGNFKTWIFILVLMQIVFSVIFVMPLGYLKQSNGKGEKWKITLLEIF